MKIRIFILAILLSPFIAQQTLSEHFDAPHISVYGTATTDVVPDLMRWQLGIRTDAKSVTEVATLHDQNVAKALAFLKHEEIAEKKTQTSQLRLSEDWDYRGGQRKLKGFVANTTISFESGTLDTYRDLWTGISKLAGVSIHNVTFDTSKRTELQMETRLQALRAARDKAGLMAAEFGSKIQSMPLMIEDQSSETDVRRALPEVAALGARASRVGAPPGDSISLGTIPIRVTVKVVFKLL